MLTSAQQRLLELPFPVSAHDFVYGNVYLRKDAIRMRLNAVDPGWQMTPAELVTEGSDIVTYSGGLMVAGVARYALGSGIITRLADKVDKKTGVITPPTQFEVARMVAKAHKTAASDLLPRCAVLFGVGEYLRHAPKETKNMNQLADYLANFPAHWALNGGGTRIRELIAALGLDNGKIGNQIEPGRRLNSLSDTWLTEQQFAQRLYDIAGVEPE